MPESRHGPDAALTPDTPDGYDPPVQFQYPMPVLAVLVAVLMAGAAVAAWRVLWVAQGPGGLAGVLAVEETADSVSFTLRGTTLVVAVAAIAVVVAVHELVHGLAYRLRGYDVSYGFSVRMGAFYAVAFHQFQTREDDLVVGAAPLAVLTPVLAALLFAPVGEVAFAAFVGLLFNTAGAAGDVYLVYRLLRMPAGTLLYDSDARHAFVFYPSDREREKAL